MRPRFDSRSSLFLGGQTASGKSSAALHLAQLLDGEIISVDSMQVYRGMDIGTAKPSPIERAAVRHHLIDIADLTETFDAARFIRCAAEALEGIRSRRKLAIFCGGTGLYFKAWLQGLGGSPGGSEPLREELERAPMEELLRELRQKDPVSFEKIDRQNPRRVIRAIEVIRLTGRPFSEQRTGWTEGREFFMAAIERERTDLHARIEGRVDEMFRAGLVEETRRLLDMGLAANRTASQALGYKQVAAHLRGELTLQKTIALVKQSTRQYAKRQKTWFARQLAARWFQAAADAPPETLAAAIAEEWRRFTSDPKAEG